MRALAVVVLAAVLAGCPGGLPPTRDDTTSPYVEDVSPLGDAVAVDATFTVRFSEAMDEARLAQTQVLDDVEVPIRVVIVPRATADTSSFISDLNTEDLSESTLTKLVPADVTADGDTATLVPRLALPENSDFSLFVSKLARDVATNFLHDHAVDVAREYRADFRTGAAPDSTAPLGHLTFPLADAAPPPNLTVVVVSFDEPVLGVSAASIALRRVGADHAVTLEAVEKDADPATTVILRIPADAEGAGCSRLCPSAVYEVALLADIHDAHDNPVAPAENLFTFTTAAVEDTLAPTFTVVGSGCSGAASASVRASEPVELSLELGTTEAYELGRSVFSRYEASFTVALASLEVGASYFYRASVRDVAGNAAPSATGSFSTESYRALINEVVTDSQQDWNDSSGAAGVPYDATPGATAETGKPTDEWIELVNTTGASIDLTLGAWFLDTEDTTPQQTPLDGTEPMVFGAGGSVTDWRAGEHLLVHPLQDTNNEVRIALRAPGDCVVDEVVLGSGDVPDGNASSLADEGAARCPDGDAEGTFVKAPATPLAANACAR